MKKLIIISGNFLLFLNIVGYLIFNKFELFNSILVSFSIISSSLMIFVLQNKENVDSYRISVSLLLIFLCLIKIIISIFSKPTFVDNFSIFWILTLILVEIILLFLVKFMNKHAKN